MIEKGTKFVITNGTGRHEAVTSAIRRNNDVLCFLDDGSYTFLPTGMIEKLIKEYKPRATATHLIATAYSALHWYGEIPQMRQMQEECAELIAAINHWLRTDRRNEDVRQNMMKEMADVEIMLAQMKLIYDVKDDYPQVLGGTIDSLDERLSDLRHMADCD